MFDCYLNQTPDKYNERTMEKEKNILHLYAKPDARTQSNAGN